MGRAAEVAVRRVFAVEIWYLEDVLLESTTPGVGTRAVLPPHSMRPMQGVWAAVEKNGVVYVHYMHNQAATAANGGVFGPVDRTGMVTLDASGIVINAVWDIP